MSLERLQSLPPNLKSKVPEPKPTPTARIIFDGPRGAQTIATNLPESLQQQLKQWVDSQVAGAWSQATSRTRSGSR